MSVPMSESNFANLKFIFTNLKSGRYPVNPLQASVKELKDGTITFNGKRCRETNEEEDWVAK